MINRAVAITAATTELIATTGFGDPVRIQNLGTGVLWVGGDDTVDNTDGFKVPVDGELDCRFWGGEVYGYAETNNCDVRVLEEKEG